MVQRSPQRSLIPHDHVVVGTPVFSDRTEFSVFTPLARPKKAIGHESQIGPWLAILQSLCLSVSRNEWAPSRQGNGTTGRKRNLSVSCDETKHETTSPEQDHSPIASARSNGWLNAETKKVSAPSRRREISLDIPFYRTFWRGTGLSVRFKVYRFLGLHSLRSLSVAEDWSVHQSIH